MPGSAALGLRLGRRLLLGGDVAVDLPGHALDVHQVLQRHLARSRQHPLACLSLLSRAQHTMRTHCAQLCG